MISELEQFVIDRLPVTPAQINEFCRRWEITEMSLFGSILRADFRSDSDIDFLVTFAPDASWDLFDWVHMQNELSLLCKRKVDIAEKKGLVNPYRRREILRTCRNFYSLKSV